MKRIFNFSAGPAMLPNSVMQQAQDEFMDWHETGMSVMEISHRGKDFIAIAEETENTLRDILNIPSNYHVLFMHGGSQGQFSAVPMNFLDERKKAAYVQTGVWGKIAIAEANRFCDAKVIASAEDRNHTYIPAFNDWESCEDAAYLHYVDNETVNGVEFSQVPAGFDVPLVVDMSSNLLSRPVNVSDFGLIYACAQKNLGPAGITIVIIRDDLLAREPQFTIPKILDYSKVADKKSMLNTPPTYPWYMVGLVAKWVKEQGGLEEMHQRALRRSQLLYDFIDQSEFYSNPVDSSVRSRMNVIFMLRDESLNQQFIDDALKANISGVKGHRLLGGMRASMYNAMPQAGAEALLAYMQGFEKRFG